MSIDKQLKKIRIKHNDAMRKELVAVESNYYKGLHGVGHVDTIVESDEKYPIRYEVDDYSMRFGSDQYSNVRCDFNMLPPINVLSVFADKVLRKEERSDNVVYRNRAVQGIFIELAKQFGKQMTGKELYDVLYLSDNLPVERNDRKRHGFRSWLLTRSYSCDDKGQFGFGRTFGQWLGKTDFFELLDGDHDLKG